MTKRVRELGTLKALGWPQRLVVRQVTGEALVQGVLGGIVGVALGIGAAAVITYVSPSLQATVAQAATQGPRIIAFGQGSVSSGSTKVSLGAPVSIGLITRSWISTCSACVSRVGNSRLRCTDLKGSTLVRDPRSAGARILAAATAS